MEIRKIISEAFRTSDRRDSMPKLLRRGNRVTLAEVFNTVGYTEGVEVGTRYGAYAKILCGKNPKLHLTCVDPWIAYNGVSQEKQGQIYNMAIKELASFNVTILKRTSMEGVKKFEDGSLDFVYIDGNHTFDHAMMDILHWVVKVRKGGIFACHDYMVGRWAGVVQAIDAYTHCHDIRPWYVTRETEPTAFWVR